MRFEYRGFSIECRSTVSEAEFTGQATVSRPSTGEEPHIAFESDELKSFPTQQQAIDYARVWSEMWCDERLNSGLKKTSVPVRRRRQDK
jgi:hypothetical protein